MLGNPAQEQHRRIRSPRPVNKRAPELLRRMLPQHAPRGRACGPACPNDTGRDMSPRVRSNAASVEMLLA